MDPHYDDYLEAIRERVCAVCLDGVFDAQEKFLYCGLPKGRTCHIKLYLPEVLEVLSAIDSPRMDDYVALLQEKVCRHCQQAPDGTCALRLKAECPLDTYFMLVAEAIEEVRSRKRHHSAPVA